jgi:hypothetical protein
LTRNRLFLIKNGPVLIKNTSFLTRNNLFLIKNTVFLVKNGSFLVKNTSFLIKNSVFLIRNKMFLTGCVFHAILKRGDRRSPGLYPAVCYGKPSRFILQKGRDVVCGGPAVSRRRAVAIGVALVTGLGLFAQMDGGQTMLPRELTRPRHGEDPRFPRDFVIGEMGRGDASEESYRIARRIVAGVVEGRAAPEDILFPPLKRSRVTETLSALGVRTWRIGGGRVENGGGVSFLVRFLGRERSVTGEIYLRRESPPPPPPPAEDKSADNSGENGAARDPAGASAPEEEAAGENGGSAAQGEEPAAQETEPAPAPPAAAGAESLRWQVDDILLEPSRSLAEGQYGPSGADMTPYERFF